MRPLLLASLLCTFMSGAAHAASSDNLCEGLYSGKDRVGVPQVAKPPFMKYYREPAFGTKVIRITQARQDQVIKPVYSTIQAWNADESLLMLYRTNPNAGHMLYDGQTYEHVRDLNIQPADLEEVHWSYTDPDAFFFVSQHYTELGAFKKYSVKTNKTTKIRDFSNICGVRSVPTGGGDIQMQSMDDDLFGFRCITDNDTWIMFSYRISTDEIVTAPIGIETTQWEAWSAPIPAPSGKQFWYQGKVLDMDLKTVKLKQDMAKAGEHANIGLTHDGHDAIFQTVFDPSPNGCEGDKGEGVGHLVVHDMDTGECRPVINEERGYPYTTSSTHVSARAHLKPGWIAMSSVGYHRDYKYFSNKKKPPVFFSEIYLANTDPDNEVVCRLAHHRSFGKEAARGAYHSYFGEPHATISPSGTRILFGSDWYDSGSVDSYVIELPSFERN
ncbi:MAG: hypothetical protein ACI9UN_002324 [Granulosicoccus sp.]|jgi:hypothetical protein